MITSLAEELGVPITLTGKHDLNMFTNNRPHQGVVLTAEPLEIEQLSTLEPADSDAVEPAAGGKGGDDGGTNASAPPPAATALPEDEEPDGESKTDNDGSTAAGEGERQWKKLVCFGTTSSGEDKP